jgi:hypothetical protein
MTALGILEEVRIHHGEIRGGGGHCTEAVKCKQVLQGWTAVSCIIMVQSVMGHMYDSGLIKTITIRCQQHRTIILATWEAEIGRTEVPYQPGQRVVRPHFQKSTKGLEVCD